MLEKYQNAMAIVRACGKPTFFVTFTCNPNWPEITRELHTNCSATDRPDLLARVFNIKLKELKKDIMKNHFFGRCEALIFTVEFQKRGLPHAHLLIITETNPILSPSDLDHFICAELPHHEPLLSIVTRNMLHGPCRNRPCYSGNSVCKKGFPKPFEEESRFENNDYPVYRRKNDGRTCVVGRSNRIVTNADVVPYNSKLLLKYNAHINVEYVASISRSSTFTSTLLKAEIT